MLKKGRFVFKLILIFVCLVTSSLRAQADLDTNTIVTEKTTLLNSIPSANTSSPCTIRIARWARYTIGDTWFSNFNSQLKSPDNYGSNGTYNKILGFTFTDISNTYQSYTAQQLKDSFDIINTGYKEMNVVQSLKLKEYNELGGIVIVNCDQYMGSQLFQTFGGIEYVGFGYQPAKTNNNTILNGIFGTGTNVNITGTESIGRFTYRQLPPNSTVLINEITGEPAVFLTGPENRVLFFWDEGVFRNVSVSGTTIDSPQEIVLHNLMVYLIDKIHINIPTVTVNSPASCAGVSVTITATPGVTGIYKYDWTVPTGVTPPGNVSSFKTKTVGDYSVIITDTATGCTSLSSSGSVTTYPEPTASVVAENRETCKNGDPLELTFTGGGGVQPYTFKYRINQEAPNIITTPIGENSVTIEIPTNIAGTFIYDLISVRDANTAACE